MFSDPQKNVLEFGFIPGQRVIDLGSGAGHYALALSQALGPTGRVYAVDLDQEMLVKLKREAVKEGRNNIEVVIGNIEKPHGTRLKDSLVDGAVFSNILFQLDDKRSALEEARRVLKPGGKACVVEWSDLSFFENSLKGHGREVVNSEGAKALFAAGGFNFEKAFDAGENHYGLIFKKPLQ